MRFLTQSQNVYRVGTVEDAEKLHEELKNDPHFTLISFGYKTKYIKEKKEIVDEYQLVTAKLQFNDEKEPGTTVNINYEVVR